MSNKLRLKIKRKAESTMLLLIAHPSQLTTHNSQLTTVPLRQGANEVFRKMTECHFVPHEG